MVRRVKKEPQGEIHPLAIAPRLPDLAVSKEGAKGTAVLRGLICPLLKRREMSHLKIKSAAFVGKRMIRCHRQRTQGLLRSKSKPMFA
jgi:hypothetical protein